MTIKRMTRADGAASFGAGIPVGYMMLGFPSDTEALKAHDALCDDGFDGEEVLFCCAMEERDAVPGRGWLQVYAPGGLRTGRALVVARRHGVRTAVKFHRQVVEELL